MKDKKKVDFIIRIKRSYDLEEQDRIEKLLKNKLGKNILVLFFEDESGIEIYQSDEFYKKLI